MDADLTAATRRWEQLLALGGAALLLESDAGGRLQSEMQMGNYSRLCGKLCGRFVDKPAGCTGRRGRRRGEVSGVAGSWR